MKKIHKSIALIFALLILVSCTAKKDRAENKLEEKNISTLDERTTMKILALKGPTGMGLSKLMEENERGNTRNAYEFELTESPENLLAKAVKDEADIIAMPSNMAAILWNKTEGEFRVLNANTLGVLNIVGAEDSIKSLSDLKGRKIYASGKGATPEFVFSYLLERNSIKPEEVELIWKSEHAEVVSEMAKDEQALGLLPQPFATVATQKIEGAKILLDLTEEWDKVEANSEFVMGVSVTRAEFVENNREAVATFMEEYGNSVDFVNENPEEAAVLIEKFGIIEKAEIAERAIPYCNIVSIEGEDLKSALEGYLKVLFEANPQSLGGAIPHESFYIK